MGKIRFVPFQLQYSTCHLDRAKLGLGWGNVGGRAGGGGGDSFGPLCEMDRFLVAGCWYSVLYGIVLGE